MADRAHYVGYTRDSLNYGDEVLMRVIGQLLGPEIEVTFGSPGAAKIAMLGGGTLINQSEWLIDEFARALNSASLGVVFGSGVGDTVFWGNHFNRWIPLLDRCAAVGVRGPHSMELLQSHGFTRAEVIGDPYLATASPEPPKAPRHTVAINIGSTHDSHWGGKDLPLAETVGATATELARRGWNLLWFQVWERDAAILECARKMVADQGQNPGTLLNARVDDHVLLNALADCELVIAEKLHACAMAVVAGTPFVALEYQPKVRDFTASVGMEGWTLPTNALSVDRLLHHVDALVESRSAIREKMIVQRELLRGRILEFTTRVKHLSAEGLQ